jgi:pyruvate,water dikinase
MGRLFGAPWTPRSQTILYESGERIFIDFSGALRDPLGRRLAMTFLPFVEPGSLDTIRAALQDPRLAVREKEWSLRSRLRVMRRLGPNALRILANLAFPAARRRHILAKIDRILAEVQDERARLVRFSPSSPAGLVSALDFVERYLQGLPPRIFLWLVSMVVSGQVAFQGLRAFVRNKVNDSSRLTLEVMRGLPNNVTTEMDLALWDTARRIALDPEGRAVFAQETPPQLAQEFLAGRLPARTQQAISQFMDRYGVRGVGEIDMGQPRWREDPTVMMQMLASYLQINQPEAAPDVVFARGAVSAQQAIDELAVQMGRQPGGWWKQRVVRFLASRTRELCGLREMPKFTIIRFFWELRSILFEAGAVWVRYGWLERAGDVVFLRIDEMKQMAVQAEQAGAAPGAANEQKAHWKTLVAERQAAMEREKRRRQSPRLMLGDGTTLYEGVGGKPEAGAKTLVGDPVSPGQVEGVVHVVLNPYGAQLAPGEILVCPGTDPAWTPLFLAAGGLVMEVGGLMTHGSVVAREYGIPAVVGVGHATQRLVTGQRIRVDGSSGQITLLD